MSASAPELATSTSTVERRFYFRFAPHAPVYLPIDGNDNTLLLNVSENGLLLSAPVALQPNFVARITIPLTGLPNPVQVNARVVWANEVRKLAGIQLLDLSDHDREQIRKWGTRESSRFLHREADQVRVTPGPSAKSSTTPAVAPSFAQSSLTQKIPPDNPPVTVPPRRVPTTQEVSTSPAARIALWGMAIAAICIAALFLLKNRASGNSFPHSQEILRRSSTVVAPPPDTQASLHNPDTWKPGAPASPAPPVSSPDTAKSEPTSPNSPPSRNSTPREEGATQPKESIGGGETPGDASAGDPPNQRDSVPVDSASPASPSATATPPAATSHPSVHTRLETQNAPSTNGVNSAANQSTSDDTAAPKNTLAPASSSANSRTTPQPRPASPPSITKDPVRNQVNSNGLAVPTPTTVPSKPNNGENNASTAPPSAHNANALVIQMDTPQPQAMQIHLPSGYRDSFFNLPGERILESPSATMHIQRSVRLPATHASWPFFHRNKNVLIGGLMSRVDPQVAQLQTAPTDIVHVVATVGMDGRIGSVRPVRGPSNLVPAVLKAVQEWRYQPTYVDGKPVETQSDLVIQFHRPVSRSARP